MASFFDPCIDIVLEGLRKPTDNPSLDVNVGLFRHQKQKRDFDLIDSKTQKVVLVGGFAESPYVHSRIEAWCRANNISVKKPDGPLSKAIAHGALGWHLHSGLRTKIARLHYGAEVQILYDPNDPDMAGREKYMDPKGDWRVRGAWQEIVRKVRNLTRCPWLPILSN